MTLFIVNQVDYPRYLGDLLNEFPLWKEGDPLPEGWELVDESAPYPEAKKGFSIHEHLTIIDGKWVRSYQYQEYDGDETEYEKNVYREIRDKTPQMWEKYFAYRTQPTIKEIAEEVNNGGNNE